MHFLKVTLYCKHLVLNNFVDKKRDSQFDIAMVRELTKAYDHCETDIDKLNSVRQMDMKMCSIIRGTVLSGICRRAQLSNTDM